MSDEKALQDRTKQHSRVQSWRVWLAGLVLAGTYLALKLNNDQYAICSRSQAIYTVDDATPRAECILVKGSYIQDVGSLYQVRTRRLPPFLSSLDARLPSSWTARLWSWITLNVTYIKSTSILIPGLADAHAHTLEYGYKMELQLDGSGSIQEVVDRIKQYIVSHPDIHKNTSAWIEGMGWDQTKWPGAQFPTASDLASDSMLNGRPIALRRVDGHATWVSPRVLKLMGDLPDTVDGGLIVRDQDGKPTGVFVDNAMALIPIPAWSEEQMSMYFDTAMRDALAHGLTSIHDAMATPNIIDFIKRKAESGDLPIRMYLMGYVASDDYWGAQVPRLVDYGRDARLNVRSIKLVADGALGSWGAAMLEPYLDNPNTKGFMLHSSAVLTKLVKAFHDDGFQVNVHCIGDLANKEVLDIFERLIVDGQANTTTWRPRIEHAQIMTEADLQRIGRLGVIASVQPTHATSDMWYAEKRLGPKRIQGAYAFQTLLRSSPNRVLPLGSDFPVEGINPLLGFYAAITRLSPEGTSPHGDGGWFPDERLTRAQALKGMTLDAAYAAFAEHERGSLVPGKKADFVVLDRDVMEVDVVEVLGTRVEATVVDGKVVYGRL
ncbi:hypothetical protein HGRIS_006609 [Hohenbuehelia grisea]|uniref:Amidohydrolase 3 domain-containing protein n=1 Tax=Hohenbuehelia grisea TaxID=104357 RepID=A0ABR3J9K1_9AGAR